MTPITLEHIAAPIEARYDLTDKRRRKAVRKSIALKAERRARKAVTL